MLSHRVAIGGEPPPRRRRFASLWGQALVGDGLAHTDRGVRLVLGRGLILWHPHHRVRPGGTDNLCHFTAPRYAKTRCTQERSCTAPRVPSRTFPRSAVLLRSPAGESDCPKD